MQKEEFYDDLVALVEKSKTYDIVVIADDFNAQVGKLSASEACLGGDWALPAQRTDNGERLLQFFADNPLFLSSTNFRHSSHRTVTWRSNSTGSLSRIDHIAIGYCWHGFVQNCRSHWALYVNSDHALALIRFVLQLSGHRRRPQIRFAVERLCDSAVRSSYEKKPFEELRTPTSSNIDEQWDQIKQAMHLATDFACGSRSSVHRKNWISQWSLGLVEQKRQLPNGKEANKMRQQLQRQLTISLKNARENWWVKVLEEMRVAGASGNSQRLFKLTRNTGGDGR